MTDQHIYNSVGDPLLILRSGDLANGITLDQGYIELEIPHPVAEHGVRLALDTCKLLALIDAADPDAMRAYLRETAPEVIADLYRPEIPEADSPEDVDEHPEPVITVTPEALDAAEQLGRYVAEIRDAFARGIAR